MNQNFVTDITHFLNEKGAIPKEIPEPARKIAKGLSQVIASVTVQPRTSSHTQVQCWSDTNTKQCTGKIDAGIELQSSVILWNCPVCGDQGSISNWKNTFWDGGYR